MDYAIMEAVWHKVQDEDEARAAEQKRAEWKKRPVGSDG